MSSVKYLDNISARIKMKVWDIVKADLSVHDRYYCSEVLYQDDAGQFYLHGRGNGKSAYGVDNGRGWIPGEVFKTMTLSRAIWWAKANNLDKTVKKLEALLERKDQS